MKFAMVVMASEQIQPNIEGLFAFLNKDLRLSELFIYQTNQDLSKKPAGKIKQMAEQFIPGIRVTLHSPSRNENGKDPSQVSKAIEEWFSSLPDEMPRVINTTCGMKTMFAGTLKFLQMPKTTLIYLDREWYQLSFEDNTITSHPITIERKNLEKSFNTLGIEKFVSIQSDFEEIESDSPPRMDCIQSLNKVVSNNWGWADIARSGANAGFAFENWFCSLIQTYSPGDLKVGLKGKEQNKTALESDVWVLKSAQLFMFDLKLINSKVKKSSLAEQITNAHAQAVKFAGRSVKVILFRPGFDLMVENKQNLKTVACRFNCEIWFQEDMIKVPKLLQGLFNTVSSRQVELENILAIARNKYGYLFSNPNDARSLARSESASKLLSLAQLFAAMDGLNRKWLGILSENQQMLIHICEEDKEKMELWITELNKNGCKAEKISKNQISICILNDGGRKFLKQYRNKSTEKSLFKL